MLSLATIRSSRRSRLRDEVLLALLDGRTLSEAQLMRAIRAGRSRLWGILVGDGEAWSRELALVNMGLVVVLRSRFGFEFRLSERGVAEARSLLDARASGRRL